MWHNIFRTHKDSTATVLRITLGVVVLAHGAQKALGWFGGPGFADTIAFFQSIGVPSPLGALIVLAETGGAIALIFGFGGRVVAAAIGGIMVGAVVTVHLSNGFFMNWSGTNTGEGFEFHLLALAMAAALVIKGSGTWSLDRVLTRQLGDRRSAT